jgi:hypothetical protein
MDTCLLFLHPQSRPIFLNTIAGMARTAHKSGTFYYPPRRLFVRNFTVISLIITIVAGAQFARADDPDLKLRWGTKVSDTEAKQALHFNPFRIMNRTYDSFLHFGIGIVDLVKFKKKNHFRKASYQFAESFLDPFDLTNSILSDLGAAIKSPHYVGRRMSDRIQVCTGNLGLIYDDYDHHHYPLVSLAFDVDHTGILIDRDESFMDQGGGGLTEIKAKGGADCSAVPIMSDEPEETAMQRLNYIGHLYMPEYDFFTANCGYFTRDVLNASGFAFPIFPDMGIGNELPITVEQAKFKERRESDKKILVDIKTLSDTYLDKLRKLFDDLEAGAVPDASAFSAQEISILTPDAYLQIIISATRGNNPAAQAWVMTNLTTDPQAYLETLKQIQHNGRSDAGKQLYKQMMNGVTVTDLGWFQMASGTTTNISMTSVLNTILQ